MNISPYAIPGLGTKNTIQSMSKDLSMTDIYEAITKYFEVDIKVKSNRPEYVFPRNCFFLICRTFIKRKISTTEIAAFVGKNRATLHYGCTSILNDMEQFKSKIRDFKNICELLKVDYKAPIKDFSEKYL